MKERPILFSGEMVRQVLDGAKTQTRRPVKFEIDGEPFSVRCPYDADRLWVRETWAKGWTWMGAQRCVFYRADGAGMTGSEKRPVCPSDEPAASVPDRIKWRPSIHMPRWASRIDLDVLSIRVERLHDISDEDIRAEGVTRELVAEMAARPVAEIPTLRDAWRIGWSHLYGAESWAANPWLWVVGFRRARS